MTALPVTKQVKSHFALMVIDYGLLAMMADIILMAKQMTIFTVLESTHAFDAHLVHWFPLRFPHRSCVAMVAYMIHYALAPCRVLLVLALSANGAYAPAMGHEWYPQHCCSGQDCKPVNCAEISVLPDYYRWHGLMFPRNASYPSHDGACHVCVSVGGTPRCLFFGGMS